MATKVNSKPCHTSEMELCPQVLTGFRGFKTKSNVSGVPTIHLETFVFHPQKKPITHTNE